jgi:sulfofructose kinase
VKKPLPLPQDQGRRYDAVCLGLNAFDHLCLVERFPTRGGKLRMSRMITSGGGQSATAACCLARLGWRVAYAGVHGDDEAGQKTEPWLREFGVDPAGLIRKPGSGSQQAFIMVEEDSAERTIVWHRDDACRLEPEDVDPELIKAGRVLHLDGHFLEPSLKAARIARQHGLLVSLDGERVYEGTRELVSLCHVVMGSHRFAQRLTGIEDPRKSLEALAALGPLWAGRTLGAEGAEMLVDGEYIKQPGFKVKAVDTTGAGDVFHAGMVHAMLAQQGPREALATACAVAAMSVTDLGGRSALPTKNELESFLVKYRS